MLSKIRTSLKASGDISGAPAMLIIAVVLVLVVAFFWWRDYAATQAKSPNYSTPGQALPGGLLVPGRAPAAPGTKPH